MAPRRRCPICGSKQWHKEPSSGLITCSEGHVLQVHCFVLTSACVSTYSAVELSQ